MNKNNLINEEVLQKFNEEIINPISQKINIINDNTISHEEVNISNDIDKLISNHYHFIDSLNNKDNFSLDDNIILSNEVIPIKKEIIVEEKNDNNKKNYNFILYMILIIILICSVFFIISLFKNNKYYLKLNGSDIVNIHVNDNYVDLGCTVYNDKNEIITSNVELINNVNTDIPGTYNVICLYKNLRIERKVIVNN